MVLGKKKDEVFSKYFRAKSDVEDSGAGPYLVKQLGENAGGKIAIESEVDKGTTVHIIPAFEIPYPLQ